MTKYTLDEEYYSEGISFAMMVIPQYVLKPGSKYRCKLTVREGSNEGAAFVVVEVRTGPSSGTFEVSPTSVQALDLVTMTGGKQKAQLFSIIPFNYCFFPNFHMGAVKKKSAYLTDLGMLTYQKLRTDRELSRGLNNCWHLTYLLTHEQNIYKLNQKQRGTW